LKLISELNTTTKDWAINVRLTSIGTQKKFNNGSKESFLIPLELIDEEGIQIPATLFREGISKYLNLLEEGRCYQISGGLVKVANKKYSPIKSDFSITLDELSTIMQIPEDCCIPKNVFNFSTISDISTMVNGSLIDIIGVVRDILPQKAVRFKDGVETFNRVFKLYDEESKSINVSVWRDLAEMELKEDQILVIKNLRVGEYNKVKELNSICDTILVHNIKSSKISRLKNWITKNPISSHSSKPVHKPRYKIMVPFFVLQK